MEELGLEFSIFAILFQALLILFYGLFTEYPEALEETVTEGFVTEAKVEQAYPMFQDVHVMMFIGFGFLMTFVKRYGFSAIGLNFVVASFCLQWGMLTTGFFHQAGNGEGFEKIVLTIDRLVIGDYSAGACLISLGAILGKTTPFQTIVMIFFELIFYAINEMIGVTQLKAVDMGGSMYIHIFGAYFGLTVSLLISPKEVKGEKHHLDGSVYHSDLFAMIGTIFLWMYWPSFNAALAPPASRHRTVINTALSLCASCTCCFATSAFLRHGHKFDMVDIQNATLAGGVAIGCSSDLIIYSWGALLIGAAAGTWSVIGYVYIQPFLLRTIGLHDTCGVHNLHGMPGIIGALAAIVTSALGERDSEYGSDLGVVFVARGEGRSASEQAWYQLATLIVSIGIGITGGLITGMFLSLPFCKKPKRVFDDSEFWETPSEGVPGGDAKSDSLNGHEMKHM